jgi:DNA-binding response OmpR family regulator
MRKYRVLLVEDDIDLGNVLKQYLEFDSFTVEHCRNGNEGLNNIQDEEYDIAIFDVMVPDINGFDLAEKLKKHNPGCPFLFLTAKGLKQDRIKGLSLGADDYVTKPFEPDELVLRLKNILSRSGKMDKEVYSIASFEFDYNSLSLRKGNEAESLTIKEAQLLKLLIENVNSVVNRKEILEKLWGSDDYFLGRSLDVFISRIRKYLSADSNIVLETVRGIGFMLKSIQNK